MNRDSKLVSVNEVTQINFSCDCVPYRDIKTLRIWNKEGYLIRKGEKAIRLDGFIKFEQDHEGQKEMVHVSHYRTHVFCRCQTESKIK
ncbi:hypothetical protein LHV56_19250 [Peribacillus frigoritolerans]|uniref:hypothetical protein n=1 Tax=Peribacillus frigoritolerans TaxID=450367 RepID=UPI00207AEBCC|nr:hypothetical protein [Peribacillus frigoritolerans]USK78969.1 hypothetical protein LHV56_19250 [Peribacillus frigoritolerans]